MGTAIKTAGVAGSFDYKTSIIPAEVPLYTLYSNPERTVVAQAERASVATANPAIFTCTYDASLPAANYYVGVRVRLFTGQPYVADNNDMLVLQVYTGEVQGALVTLARYRTLTLDTTSSDGAVTGALLDAEEELSEWLRRPLVLAQRTERLQISSAASGLTVNNRVYPSATPVVAAPVGMTVGGNGQWIEDVSADSGQVFEPTSFATITYSGGFTTDTVPRIIERAIAFMAYYHLHPQNAMAVPVGATTVSQGDASVTFKDGASAVDALDSSIRRRVRGYRRR